MSLELILKDIPDQYARENFSRIARFFNSENLLDSGFKFFEIEIVGANTIVQIPHGLNFIPYDIIHVSVTGDHNYYFVYQEFDKTNLHIFVSGPCKLRFFAGLFKGQSYGRKVSDFEFVAPNAAAGSTVWYTGAGAPLAGLGLVGDFYLNLTNDDVYLKTGIATWTLVGNISSTHPATAITINDDAANNTIIGDTLQEYLDRFNEPSQSQKPTYAGDGTITNVEFFSSATQIVANRIFRADLTYDVDLQPITEVWKIYSKTNGTTILKTISMAYTWVANQLTNKTQVTA